MKNSFFRIVVFVIAISLVVSGVIVVQRKYLEYQNNKQYEQLANEIQKKEKGKVTEPILAEKSEPTILERYKELYNKNSDLIGWMQIDGTVINYPVMQKKEEPDYYLKHNYYKEENKYGCLYIDEKCDVFTPSTNLIIYGHNMKDSSMFGSLSQYKKEDYYNNHKIIHFDTLYEEADYEIVSVFLSQVYKKSDDVFKYYNFINASSKEEFNSFVKNIKALALYDTGVVPKYNDTFITLSTCSYHIDRGRLVVVARKVV